MRLNIDARTRRILRRLPVVNVYSLAELVLLGGLAIQSARLFWTIVTPIAPLGDWRPAEVAVPGRPYDVLAGFDPFFRLGARAQAPATVTALQLTLFGIRVDEASGRGSAIVAGPDNVQKSVAVGEEIMPGVRLKSVSFDHITIDRGGASEDLYLVQSDAPTAGTAGPEQSAPAGIPVAPPAAAATAGIKASQIRNEIGFIPRIDGGRVSGLVVRAQGSGTVFRNAGLRDGDVVTAIGGRPITGPQDLDRIATEFAGGGSLPITVERGQQTLALALTIAPQ